jgi:hypothetical protein
MKKHIKIGLLTLIAATALAAPIWLHAQDSSSSTNAPSTSDTTPAPVHHKHGAHGVPFRGTVDGVDTNAMTLTVGSRTFQMTSSTKISSNGQPGILADATVGEPVTGYYRPDPDNSNTLNAVTIHLGKGKGSGHKHKASSDTDTSSSTTSTNSATGN